MWKSPQSIWVSNALVKCLLKCDAINWRQSAVNRTRVRRCHVGNEFRMKCVESSASRLTTPKSVSHLCSQKWRVWIFAHGFKFTSCCRLQKRFSLQIAIYWFGNFKISWLLANSWEIEDKSVLLVLTIQAFELKMFHEIEDCFWLPVFKDICFWFPVFKDTAGCVNAI